MLLYSATLLIYSTSLLFLCSLSFLLPCSYTPLLLCSYAHFLLCSPAHILHFFSAPLLHFSFSSMLTPFFAPILFGSHAFLLLYFFIHLLFCSPYPMHFNSPTSAPLLHVHLFPYSPVPILLYSFTPLFQFSYAYLHLTPLVKIINRKIVSKISQLIGASYRHKRDRNLLTWRILDHGGGEGRNSSPLFPSFSKLFNLI